MKAESAWLVLAVHTQPLDAIQLVTEVHANRSDRRRVAQAGADVVPQTLEAEVPRFFANAAAVQEQHAAETLPEGHAQLGGEIERRRAAEWKPAAAERRHLVPA